MKTLIILLLVTGFHIKGQGQFYLGRTEESVRKELKAEGHKNPFKVKHDNGTFSLIYDVPVGQYIIGFHGVGLSLVFTMVPKTDVLVTSTIQEFNNTFVKISDTSWKAYKNGKVFDIVLDYSKNNGVYSFKFSENLVK